MKTEYEDWRDELNGEKSSCIGCIIVAAFVAAIVIGLLVHFQ